MRVNSAFTWLSENRPGHLFLNSAMKGISSNNFLSSIGKGSFHFTFDYLLVFLLFQYYLFCSPCRFTFRTLFAPPHSEPNNLWMITDLKKLAKGRWKMDASCFLPCMCEIASTESALGQSSTASRFKMIWLSWFKSVTFCRLEILYY